MRSALACCWLFLAGCIVPAPSNESAPQKAVPAAVSTGCQPNKRLNISPARSGVSNAKVRSPFKKRMISIAEPYQPKAETIDVQSSFHNLMRQYASSASVDLAQPHYIRWKFRLAETVDTFAADFITFNDRVHFFARNAPRLTAGTGRTGIRISCHPIAAALARTLGRPLTATSANLVAAFTTPWGRRT